jgi:hypothetical protein
MRMREIKTGVTARHTEWSYGRDNTAGVWVRLENAGIRVEVLPDAGAKIWRLVDKARSIDWIWRSDRVAPRPLPLGTVYDDHWAGGWEELFPNDAPGHFDGRDLPDHGEWWSQPWAWEVEESSDKEIRLRLWRDGVVTRVSYEKWVVVRAEERNLTVRYRITNREAAPLTYLFKQHLPVAVTPTHRLELPGGRVTRVDPMFSTRMGGDGPYDWPHVAGLDGAPVNLSILPPVEAGQREFVYISDLPEGWCGIRDHATGAALRLRFSRSIFRYTWLFMDFGGWRGLYTVVLEPCTNMPKDLEVARRLGQCGVLGPNGVLECEIRAELF